MRKILVILLSFFVCAQSFAAALPAFSPKFGQAMAGVVQQKAIARGFAANDPRFIATQAAAGTIVTGLVTAGAVAAGAPIWATLALGAVAAGAVALGIDALTKWLFNEDGTVTASSSSGGSTDSGSGGVIYSAIGYNGVWFYSSIFIDVATKQAIFNVYGNDPIPSYVNWSSPNPSFCSAAVGGYCNGYVLQTCVGYTCTAAQRPYSIIVRAATWVPPAGSIKVAPAAPPPSVPKKMSDAVADLPAGDMAKPVNP